MKKRIAYFTDEKGREHIYDVEMHSWVLDEDGFGSEYIRTTEIETVEFSMLDSNKVSSKKIAIIDRKIKEFKAASQSKLNELEQRKQELLALPSSESSDEL